MVLPNKHHMFFFIFVRDITNMMVIFYFLFGKKNESLYLLYGLIVANWHGNGDMRQNSV